MSYRDVPTVVFGRYEWDPAKAESNRQKHGIAFEEAALALEDPKGKVTDASTQTESRLATLCFSPASGTLVVVHVERGERDRIVSARRASRREWRQYTAE